MKKILPISILLIAATFILSSSLIAQEKTEITIKVKKDGKLVQDTTYKFDDSAEARHAIKMMEVLNGDGEHHHNADCTKKKHVKVIVSGDEHGTWHMDEEGLVEIEEEGLVEIEEEVYVISGDDAEIEIEKILEESDGDEENVKIIVIKKKSKKQ